MNEQERGMIEGLFERLQQAETQAGTRDGEAEALIREHMTRQPSAPYLLTQVVLVQEQGLRNLQTRVEELERQLTERPQGGGGFLGGLFGGGQAAQPAPRPAAKTPAPPPAPSKGAGWSNSPSPAQGAAAGRQTGGQGGGFMAGAMQTAMGVAGGVLLANAVSGMFADDAEAAETPAEPEMDPMAAAPEEIDTPVEEEDGGFFDDGGGDEDF